MERETSLKKSSTKKTETRLVLMFFECKISNQWCRWRYKKKHATFIGLYSLNRMYTDNETMWVICLRKDPQTSSLIRSLTSPVTMHVSAELHRHWLYLQLEYHQLEPLERCISNIVNRPSQRWLTAYSHKMNCLRV